MNKPKQPTQDLIDLYHIGPIWKFEYDMDLSDDSRAEAEHDAHGCSFNYECIIHAYGRKSGTQLCNPSYNECRINESTLKNCVEVRVDNNSYGFWQLTTEARELVQDWLKWLDTEKADRTRYINLYKKFGGASPSELNGGTGD